MEFERTTFGHSLSAAVSVHPWRDLQYHMKIETYASGSQFGFENPWNDYWVLSSFLLT